MSRRSRTGFLITALLVATAPGGARAQASLDYETPRPWIEGAPHPRVPVDEREVRTREVFSRKDLLPPPGPPDHRSVEVRALEHSLQGVVTRSVVEQIDHPGRIRTRLLDLPGEVVTFETARDLDDDGIREVFLGISPPLQPGTRRFLVFTYNTRDHRFVPVFETPPMPGGRIRFLPEKGPLGARHWLVAVDDPGPGARSSYRTRLHRLGIEELVPVETREPRPVDPHDQVIWAEDALGRGDYLRGEALARSAIGHARGEIRERAFLSLARALIAQQKVDPARRALDLLSTSPAGEGEVHRAESMRLRTFLDDPALSPVEVQGLVQAEAMVRGRRDADLIRTTGRFLDRHPESRIRDEILMLQAMNHIDRGRDLDALGPLSRIVMEFPDSPHFRQAQRWMLEIHDATAPPPDPVDRPVAAPPASPGPSPGP